LAKLDRNNDVIEAYRQVLRINPEYPGARHNLGVGYNKLTRYNDAIESLRQAISINPDYIKARYNLGIAYVHSGNRTAALAAVQKLRSLDPGRRTFQLDHVTQTKMTKTIRSNFERPRQSLIFTLAEELGLICID